MLIGPRHDDRKSTSGYYMYLRHLLVLRDSGKQKVYGRSSTEAKFRALMYTM